jgi:hypothetical protein
VTPIRNVFDHNGWRPSVDGAVPTIFNHNLYIQDNNKDMVVRGNIIARGASHGLQARSGGIVEGNLFMDNSMAFFIANSPGKALDNVVVHGSMRPLHPDGWPRGYGIDMFDLEGSVLISNVVAQTPEGTYPISRTRGVTRDGNVAFNWGPYSDTTGTYPDVFASIAGYDALIGGYGTMESFQEVHSHCIHAQINFLVQYNLKQPQLLILSFVWPGGHRLQFDQF